MKGNLHSEGSKDEKQSNQITAEVRYQSEVVQVSINKNASVEALLADALRSTGNDVGQKDRFQLKLAGTVLDPKKKVNDYQIENGSMLVLVLIAGGGGNVSNCIVNS